MERSKLRSNHKGMDEINAFRPEQYRKRKEFGSKKWTDYFSENKSVHFNFIAARYVSDACGALDNGTIRKH